jgi:hypothetical protein
MLIVDFHNLYLVIFLEFVLEEPAPVDSVPGPAFTVSGTAGHVSGRSAVVPGFNGVGPVARALGPSTSVPSPAALMPGFNVPVPVARGTAAATNVSGINLARATVPAATVSSTAASGSDLNVTTATAPAVTVFVPPAEAPSADPVNDFPGPPPASVDFVSSVWNSFSETVLPLISSVAREAVRTNKDPVSLSNYDSVKIQNEILEGTYSKYTDYLKSFIN